VCVSSTVPSRRDVERRLTVRLIVEGLGPIGATYLARLLGVWLGLGVWRHGPRA
jgi:hypothetical protein